MRIIKETPSQLILQERSRLSRWTSWILGVILMLLGLKLWSSTVIWIAQPTSLTCQRFVTTQGNCELTRLSWSLSPEVIEINIPLSELQGVKVAPLDDDGSRMYDVILLTDRGDIPFFGYYTNGTQSKQEIADQINQFIKISGRKTLDLKKRQLLVPLLLFGATLLILGFGWNSMSEPVKFYIFDKSIGKLAVKKENAFGTNFFTEYPFSEIVDVTMEATAPDSDRDIYYKALILLASGDRLILFEGWNQKELFKKIVDRIRNYLNLKSIE